MQYKHIDLYYNLSEVDLWKKFLAKGIHLSKRQNRKFVFYPRCARRFILTRNADQFMEGWSHIIIIFVADKSNVKYKYRR